MSAYPEHDKLTKVSDTSQAIGAFLDWLQGQGVHLMVWRTFNDPDDCVVCGPIFSTVIPEQCDRCRGTGRDPEKIVTRERWVPREGSIQDLLAEYFEIDLKKIDAEKDDMLASIRAAL